MLPGISPICPFARRIAPFRCTNSLSPKCSSSATKLWAMSWTPDDSLAQDRPLTPGNRSRENTRSAVSSSRGGFRVRSP